MERANGYLETSLLPDRSFDSPVDFTNRLTTRVSDYPVSELADHDRTCGVNFASSAAASDGEMP